MNYYIADMHLFARAQTAEGPNWDGRPFANIDEMHDYMLTKWNSKITNGDTVYIAGDMSQRGRNDALIALVAQLKGRKVLCVGNHDWTEDYRYKILYDEICDRKKVSETVNGKQYKFIVDHFPLLFWDGQHKGTILLYAHVHNSIEDDFFQDAIARMNASEELSLRRSGGQTIHAINIGACKPWMHYEPRTAKELLEAAGII